ncbi:SRPBCC family protein [Sphingomonas sp.]|uniref:SRPBCC family protein n=1 Tax=Sphingomonas sp. TaxID=28214 RepID=UPI003B3B0DE9
MADTQELSVTALIEASPAEVYRVWIERLAEWWCPRPWMTEVVAIDPRPGGVFHTILRGPEGEANDLMGVFLDVVPGERIVTTDAFGPGWVPQVPFMVGLWTFAEEGDHTRYTATARHWNADTLRQHEAMGFHDGWSQATAQLKALVERGKAG